MKYHFFSENDFVVEDTHKLPMMDPTSGSYDTGEMSYAEFTSYRQKRNSDYISKLWRQQRDLINRELQLTQKAHQESLLSKHTLLPSIRPAEMSQNTGDRRQVFQSRVRPAINRGKTMVLAIDPERHIQLEKERIAQQEQRNRPKSPIQLIPIDVKPLRQSTTPKSPTTASKSSQKPSGAPTTGNLSRSLPYNLTSSIELWKKPVSLLGKKLQAGNQVGFRDKTGEQKTVLESLAITMKTCQNIHTMNNLAKFCSRDTVEDSQSPISHKSETQHMLDTMITRRTLKPRKPMTGFGSYSSCKTPASSVSNFDLILKASSMNPTLEEDPLEAVWKAQSSQGYCSCDNDDEDCSICGKYSSKLPIIPFMTRTYTNIPSNRRESTNSHEFILPEADINRRTLVVELPNINYTPATPPRLIIPKTSLLKAKATRIISLQKILKQKELRQRELSNLFADITELSHVNHVLSNYGVPTS